MSLFTNMAQRAEKMLAKYGDPGSVTFVRSTLGAYTPGTPPATSIVSKVVNAVVLEYADKLIDGDKILSDDKRVLVSGAAGVTAIDATKDYFIIDSVQHTIIRVKKPVQQNVLFDIQVRRTK